MAKQTQKATLANNKPRTSSSRTFLCCFGSSQDGDTMSPPNKATGNRKRNRWFCWSLKVNSAAAKTVPVVDLTDVPPPSKSKSSKPAAEKVTGKRRAMFRSRKAPCLSPAAATDQEPPKQQTKGAAQNTVLENRRVPDSRNDTTGQRRRSFCRKIDAIRTRSSSQPGSPVEDKKQHNKPSSTRRVILRPAATNFRKPGQTEIDPVVGMSIILVTLLIMLVWGRVCAILSTSAWFYIVPRLSKSTKSSDRKHGHNNNNDGDDQNGSFWDEQGLSYEYKKRVVLEGFLERNRRSTSSS